MTTSAIPVNASQRIDSDASPVLEFRDVSISFPGNSVLEDVTFKVAPNETRVLLGPAGVGKSVLLKLANGLLCPDGGSVHLFGQEVSQMPERDLFALRTRYLVTRSEEIQIFCYFHVFVHAKKVRHVPNHMTHSIGLTDYIMPQDLSPSR